MLSRLCGGNRIARRAAAGAAPAARAAFAARAAAASSSTTPPPPPPSRAQLQQRGPLGVELARDVRPPGKPAPSPSPDASCGPLDEDDAADYVPMVDPTSGEWGGPTKGGAMPEPTRFGDWERKGRCTDFV